MNMTFSDVYIEYMKYVEYRLKGQSKRTLKDLFKNKILPYFKDYKINEINELTYLNFQNYIESFNYSNNYKSNIHYAISNFYEYLIKFYGFNVNIPRKVGSFKLKNEKKEYNIYSYKDFKKFIKQFDKNAYVYKQFFNLMFFTGCRPGEAMALKFKDLKCGYLSINKTIDEHGSREIGTPKNESSIRIIQLDLFTRYYLWKLKRYYKYKYNDFNDDKFIFGYNKPLSATTINRYKLKACTKANLKAIKLHEFRHSHATLLVSKKLMIKEISRRLGHSNCKITLDIYTHATREHEKRVIKTLNFIRLN